ncbi:uncharacterized protein LOC8040514 [Ixodes scapularis]|uniref:uncharacterized protein LOC8040514 n=1 Tax=Ixodes scapularis TaxID=6945 RepID=UPI001C389DE3|nr:uncharacterized protein LOC8040514 [Ixodes scapularis]
MTWFATKSWHHYMILALWTLTALVLARGASAGTVDHSRHAHHQVSRTTARKQTGTNKEFLNESEQRGAVPSNPFSGPMLNPSSPLLATTYYYNPHRQGTPSSGVHRHHDLLKESGDQETCRAADGRDGTCYDAVQCLNRGGTPMGRCENGVCCVFEVSCGEASSERTAYVRNPGFPGSHNREAMCKVRVSKRDADVCQFRLDFLTLDLARPMDGNCSQDMLVVSGQNENNQVPRVCGLNTGQHAYVDVEESGGISLNLMMVGSYSRKFDIKVTQLECEGPQSAPSHCLQYFWGTHGTVKSFNYDEAGGSVHQQGYPNDLDYVVCLRKEPGFCSVSYEIATADDEVGPSPFGVGAVPTQREGVQLTSSPIVAECPDDYLIIGGVRMCSTGHDGDIELRHTRDLNVTGLNLITDSTPGPFLMRFVSNNVNNARGFKLHYRQNPCK